MRQLILGTAGHIDHGKTALVTALTGIDTDRLPEEKARGITIDIGFALLTTGDCQVGIVDVPGHERFVRNMLAGAAGIDMALLVVAADDSVMPQTREHLSILQLLGIKRGVIALTKCDLPDPTWIDLVDEEVRELVSETFLENAPIVHTSARTGAGIDDLKIIIEETSRLIDADEDDAPFRLAVDRAFVMEGLGTIVTGTVWSGTAAVGDELDWLPINNKVRIRGLHSHGKPVMQVKSGQRAAIQLANVHHSKIHRGHELAASGYLKPSKIITVMLEALADSPRPIKHRSRLNLHIGSGEVTAVVSLLRGNTLEPGEKMEAQFFCAEAITAVAGQAFVIRCESPVCTLGGGVVLNPNAVRMKRQHTAPINHLHDLTSDDPIIRVSTALRFQGLLPWNDLDISRIAGVKPAEVVELVHTLIEKGILVRLPGVNMKISPAHTEVIREMSERILTIVLQLHKNYPLEAVIPIRRLSRRFEYIESSVFEALLAHLIDNDQLTKNDNGVAIKGYAPNLSVEQKHMMEIIPTMIKDSGFMPPDSTQLAKTLQTTETEVQPILDLCVASGELIHIAGGMFLQHDVHDKMIQSIRAVMLTKGELSVGEIRETLKTSRKFAIPICEYFDRIGFTKRRGNVRIPGANFNNTSQQPADFRRSF